MNLQKEREMFKAWFKKEYLGIDNLANQGDEGAITCRDYAYVGWQAAKAQAIPDGFVVVPKEPTQEMLDSARDWSIKKYGRAVGNDGAYGCYKAMIAAAC